MLKWLMNKSRRSVRFYKIFFSYLVLVLLLLIVLGSFSYASIISALEKQVEEAQIAADAQLRDLMDTRFRELQRIAVQISSNTLLTPFALAHPGFGSYQAVSELKKYLTSNSFIHDIVLKYDAYDNDRVFAATGVYTENEFAERIYHYPNWTSSMNSVIRSLNGPVIRPVEPVFTVNDSSPSHFATYLYPLPAYSGTPYGVVMFLLDEKTLLSISENMVSLPGASLYIVDENGQTIFTTAADPQFPEELAGSLSAAPGTVATGSINGVSYSVIRESSAINDWSYITLIPTTLFLEKVLQSRRLLGIIMIMLLAGGTVVSFVLANNNYQKLRQLAQLFADKKETETRAADSTDEIVYLSNAVRELSGRESMMAKLKSKKGLIRENVLLSLLKGKQLEADDLEHTLELAEVRFDYPHFAAVLLVIDDYAAFQSAYSGSMQELFKFSMLNVAEELALEIGRGYGVTTADDSGVALIVNLDNLAAYKSHIGSFAERVQDFFKTNYKFTLSIGIGQVYESLTSVGLSYSEARRAIHYRFVRGTRQALFFEELQSHLEERPVYFHELEDLLVKSIRQGNPDEAEQCIRSMIGTIRSLSVTPEAARLAGAGLLHTLLKVSDEIQAASAHELHQEVDALQPYDIETIDVLEQQMIRVCRHVCEDVAGRKESRNFKLRDDILLFLQTNYSDSSLTLEKIADHFQKSPSYITRFIKDQTGFSLIRYLDSLRMSKAKELLLNEQQSLADVVKRVGYVDVSNFIRKFKKMEGVTPEQYRSLQIKG
jgi:two-component system response regulator YesN